MTGRILPYRIWTASIVMLAAVCVEAAPVPWLYDVDVDIADRSADVRAAAAREGLATVLTRLSGLANLPDSPVLDAALSSPDRYTLQFGYGEREREGERIPLMRFRFSDAAVLRLVTDAALPLWSSNRPTLMVWVTVEQDGARDIVGADGGNPLAEALLARARFRGLPLVLPLMDLDDQLDVSPGAVWGNVTPVLRGASVRYGADDLLIGRADVAPSGRWHAEWRYGAAVNDEASFAAREESFTVEGASAEEIADAAVDHVVDALVTRFAVAAGDEGELRLEISGVTDLAQYAGVLRYLQSLEFVSDVRVVEVDRERVALVLATRTPWDRFSDLLALDGRLVPDPAPNVGSTFRLQWLGAVGS